MPDSEIDVVAVVDKLIGPIAPLGDSAVDGPRYENQKRYEAVAAHMIKELSRVARDRDCEFFSVKKAGNSAYEFLQFIAEETAADTEE